MFHSRKVLLTGGVLFASALAPASGANGKNARSLLTATSRSHAARAKRATCHPTAIDTFRHGISAYDLTRNVSLRVRTVRRGDPLALPGQRGSEHVLSITPGQSQDVRAADRQFPIDENWSRASSVSLWFYGRHTGAAETVQLLGASGSAAATPPLVWSDEFNGSAGSPPDPSVWKHEVGDGSANGNTGWGNHELEYYTSSTDNASLDGRGDLSIVVRKTFPQDPLNCYYGPCQYTSARLTTQNTRQFTYGRIEARIRIPQGAGMWPAFWALGTNIGRVGWPQSGEIDVMENVGRQPRTLYGTVHGPGYSGANGLGGTYQATADLADDFHVYAVDWRPGRVDWLIDGKTYFSATAKDVAPNHWVFDHPFFLLLNLAVGGDFGQSVGQDTVFPQSMLVDYVRVYGVTDSAERFDSAFKDNFSGWKRITLPLKSFVRSGDQPVGAPSGPLQSSHVSGIGFKLPPGDSGTALVAQVSLNNCPHP